jgi:hypothetical protein
MCSVVLTEEVHGLLYVRQRRGWRPFGHHDG